MFLSKVTKEDIVPIGNDMSQFLLFYSNDYIAIYRCEVVNYLYTHILILSVGKAPYST